METTGQKITQEYADDYQVHLKIGDGGQANVYLASKNNQLYALKVYLPGASK
jgi:serine/threonine protein kinase